VRSSKRTAGPSRRSPTANGLAAVATCGPGDQHGRGLTITVLFLATFRGSIHHGAGEVLGVAVHKPKNEDQNSQGAKEEPHLPTHLTLGRAGNRTQDLSHRGIYAKRTLYQLSHTPVLGGRVDEVRVSEQPG
jgi:hypothetical protein